MDIYKEEIIDHYENPRNYGDVDGYTVCERDSNASCGDMVEFQLSVKNGVVEDVGWKGVGCAITMASSSKLSEWVKGRKVEELKKKSVEELVKIVGIEVSAGRKKCVLLPIQVLKKLVE